MQAAVVAAAGPSYLLASLHIIPQHCHQQFYACTTLLLLLLLQFSLTFLQASTSSLSTAIIDCSCFRSALLCGTRANGAKSQPSHTRLAAAAAAAADDAASR
jgi:hypothetical protein